MWHPGVFNTFSEPQYNYITPWEKNKIGAVSQLFLNTVYVSVSVIPMSLEFSVEFPIHQNGSKSLSGPSDTAEHS